MDEEQMEKVEFAFLSGEIYFKGKFHQNFIMIYIFFSLEVAWRGDFKRLA